MTINIVRVTALPTPLAANTIYYVIVSSTEVQVVVTGNTNQIVRKTALSVDILAQAQFAAETYTDDSLLAVIANLPGLDKANPYSQLQTFNAGDVVSDSFKRAPPTLINNITPAGNTTWYRLATFPSANSYQLTRLHVFVFRTAGNGHQCIEIDLSKATYNPSADEVTQGVAGEFINRGEFGSEYGIDWIRVVDGGTNQPTHIDVRFVNTDAVSIKVMAESVSSSGNFISVPATLIAQDTAAVDKHSVSTNCSRAYYSRRNGWTSDPEQTRITPEMYGAVGDNAADDRIALQTAGNLAIANNMTLLLRSVVYKIGAGLVFVLSDYRMLKIEGCGWTTADAGPSHVVNGSILHYAPSAHDGYALTIAGFTSQVSARYLLSEFAIQCDTTYRSGGMFIGGGDYGIKSVIPSTIHRIGVLNCSFYGLLFNNSQRCVIDGCFLDATESTTTYPVLRIEADSGSTGLFCGDLNFRDCTFAGNGVPNSGLIMIRAGTRSAGAANTVAGLHFTDCIGYYGEVTVRVDTGASGAILPSVNDLFFQSCAFDGTLSDSDVDNAFLITGYGNLNDFKIQDSYLNSYNSHAIQFYMSGGAISNINITDNFIGRCFGQAVNIITGAGTARSINILGNQLMDVALESTGVGSTNKALFVANGNIRSLNVSNNNHNYNGTIGAPYTRLPEYVLTASGAVDFVILTGNTGRWGDDAPANYSGAITNIVNANNLRQTS